MTTNTNPKHYLEGKWFHTFAASAIQQQGRILKVLENNVVVCALISVKTFAHTAVVLINLNDYTSPQNWIQFYDCENEMKEQLEVFSPAN